MPFISIKLDMLLKLSIVAKFPENTVYIFEFKVVEEDKTRAEKPMEQIKTKKYYEKDIGVIRNIILIGVEFLKNEPNLVSFEWEAL